MKRTPTSKKTSTAAGADAGKHILSGELTHFVSQLHALLQMPAVRSALDMPLALTQQPPRGDFAQTQEILARPVNAAPPPAPEENVIGLLDRLHSVCDAAHQFHAQLEKQLEPLVPPAPQEATVGGCATAVPSGGISPLADKIMHAIGSLGYLIERQQRLANRLQLPRA